MRGTFPDCLFKFQCIFSKFASILICTFCPKLRKQGDKSPALSLFVHIVSLNLPIWHKMDWYIFHNLHCAKYARIRVSSDPYFLEQSQNRRVFPYTGKYESEKTHLLAYFSHWQQYLFFQICNTAKEVVDKKVKPLLKTFPGNFYVELRI